MGQTAKPTLESLSATLSALQSSLKAMQTKMATKKDLESMAARQDLNFIAIKQNLQSLEDRVVSGVNEIIQAQTDHVDQRFDGVQKQINGIQLAMTDKVDVPDHEALKKRVTVLEKSSLKARSV